MDNFSKEFSTDNLKKTGLYKYVYDFSLGYDSIDIDDIFDIHIHLMKKTLYKTMSGFTKKIFIGTYYVLGQ